MIKREHDATFINRIANSAAVKPFIDLRPDKSSPLDMTPSVGSVFDTGVVWLSNGLDALAVFEVTAPGIYQAHLLFADTCRGRRAIDAARGMLAWLFAHGATIVWGCIDRCHRPAMLFGRLIGATVLPGDAECAIFEVRADGFSSTASRNPQSMAAHSEVASAA